MSHLQTPPSHNLVTIEHFLGCAESAKLMFPLASVNICMLHYFIGLSGVDNADSAMNLINPHWRLGNNVGVRIGVNESH